VRAAAGTISRIKMKKNLGVKMTISSGKSLKATELVKLITSAFPTTKSTPTNKKSEKYGSRKNKK